MFGTVDRRAQLAAPLPDGFSQDPPVDAGLLGEQVPAGTVELPEPSEAELAEARLRSARSGFEMVDLRRVQIDASAVAALPVAIARRHRAAVIGLRFGVPLIALSAPENLLAIDDIYLAAGTDVLIVVAPERQVEACVEALYPATDAATEPADAPWDDVPWTDEPEVGAVEAAGEAAGEASGEACAGYGAEDVDWYRVGAPGADGTGRPPASPPAGGETPADGLGAPAAMDDPVPARSWLDPVDPDGAVATAPFGVDADPPVDLVGMPPLPATELAPDGATASEGTAGEAMAGEATAGELSADGAAGDAEALPWWMQASPTPPVPFDEPPVASTSLGQVVAEGMADVDSPFDTSLHGTDPFDPAAFDPSAFDLAAYDPAMPGPAGDDLAAYDPSPLDPPPLDPPVVDARVVDAWTAGTEPDGAGPFVSRTPASGQPRAEPRGWPGSGWSSPGWVPPGAEDGSVGVAEAEPETPAPWRQPDVGDVLAGRGALSDEQLVTAREASRMTGRPLRAVLAELQLVNDRLLLEAVAEVAGRQLVDLDQWPIDGRAGRLLPESVARRYGVLPIGFEGGRPIVATSDPSDVVALDDVRTLLGGDIDVVVSEREQIEVYLGRVYRRTEETDLAAHNAALAATGMASAETRTMANLVDLQVSADEAPVVKFVNLVLQQALHENASDVHIEPSAKELVVRCRIDGVLHQLTTAPKAIQGNVTSRLKVMAGLDIAEHRVPQDGRFALGAGNRQVDLRLATLPTVHGEKIVMRILDKSTAPLELSRLGFLPRVLERYQTAYRRPAGTILVTGPTGSGKSTTLYATLAELNSPERNLITVEDPVEYQMVGVNQVQVNPKAGLTFASALRSILRADPDIVLVGEVRDKETATIAVEAALTGHLVLSSLHTNDAVSTPMRLIEMGVEPFLVGSAIDCILAQRLGRILCQRCAEPYEPSAAELRAAGWDDEVTGGDTVRSFRRPRGCQACSNTGYRGRVAIHEVLLVDEAIERAILDRAPTDVIGRLARDQGMTSLRWDGLHKAALGMTSLEEIMRVVV